MLPGSQLNNSHSTNEPLKPQLQPLNKLQLPTTIHANLLPLHALGVTWRRRLLGLHKRQRPTEAPAASHAQHKLKHLLAQGDQHAGVFQAWGAAGKPGGGCNASVVSNLQQWIGDRF